MRRIVVAAVAAALCAALVPAARAGHRPQEFCSESGDVCQSTKRVNGVRKLTITLGGKYFSRYKLCVKAPDDATTCKRFKIKDQGSVYGSSVRWRKHFPDAGEGAYTVTWKNRGTRIGARLGFHKG
ncbi:MAG TPA: hypothetical protein VHN37_11705 [Actinomycetota bacterium]|nr:hypothetical protein [Actinomycetota bacterium]